MTKRGNLNVVALMMESFEGKWLKQQVKIADGLFEISTIKKNKEKKTCVPFSCSVQMTVRDLGQDVHLG